MKRPTARRLAPAAARAQWALTELEAIAGRGYAAQRQFAHIEYLLERASRLRVPGLPRRGDIMERLVALEGPCTARWEQVKAERRCERKKRHNAKGANIMTDVLEAAEGRVPAAAKQAEQEQAVAMVREEIGPANYQAARQQLSILENAIRKEYLPWIARVTAIAQKAGSYPNVIKEAVERIGKVCEAGPRQLREGIAAYENIQFAQFVWTDGRSADVNRRAAIIAGTRRLLRSFDGLLSYMEGQKKQAERYIQEAEWPRRAGEPRATATAVREPERRVPDAGIPVETAFELGGKVLGARPQ